MGVMTFSRHVVDLNVIIGGYLTIKNMISARYHCSCENILEKFLAFGAATKYVVIKKYWRYIVTKVYFLFFCKRYSNNFCIFILLH